MGRFLRPSLASAAERLGNYAHRPHAECDLSLVSGPFIWHDEVARGLARVQDRDLQAYRLPPFNPDLVAAIAAWEQVPENCLWFTPGADVAIEAVLSRFLDPGDRLGILVPNFPRFAIVGAALAGVELVEFNTLERIPRGLKLVAICTPNNPSTAEVPFANLQAAIAAHPDVLFCVDGAFDWSGSFRLADLCHDADNVIVLKSFSKIGLAGLRLGYAVSAEPNIRDLALALSPFSVSAAQQCIGLEVARRLSRVALFQEILDAGFAQIHVALGDAVVREAPVPFYLLRTRVDSTRAADLLAKAGISVVDGKCFRALPPNLLRVAIGDRVANQRLLTAIDRLGILV